jgi:hypothetical protein
MPPRDRLADGYTAELLAVRGAELLESLRDPAIMASAHRAGLPRHFAKAYRTAMTGRSAKQRSRGTKRLRRLVDQAEKLTRMRRVSLAEARQIAAMQPKGRSLRKLQTVPPGIAGPFRRSVTALGSARESRADRRRACRAGPSSDSDPEPAEPEQERRRRVAPERPRLRRRPA